MRVLMLAVNRTTTVQCQYRKSHHMCHSIDHRFKLYSLRKLLSVGAELFPRRMYCSLSATPAVSPLVSQLKAKQRASVWLVCNSRLNGNTIPIFRFSPLRSACYINVTISDHFSPSLYSNVIEIFLISLCLLFSLRMQRLSNVHFSSFKKKKTT